MCTKELEGDTKWISPKNSCDARGLGLDDYAEGVKMGNMDLLGEWMVEADKVIVF